MQFSAMWYLPFGNFTPENTGYAIIDFNKDGRDELVIGSINEDSSTDIIDIYIIIRNRAWHVAAANERDHFYLQEGGFHILERASNDASDSFIASYYADYDKLNTSVAYKTENGKTYKYDSVYSKEAGTYVNTWEETDKKPEYDRNLQFKLLNVELTQFSEYKSVSGERVLINAKTEGNGQIASSDDGSEPVFDEEYAYQQAVYNALKGTVVKLSAKAAEAA